MNQRSLLYKNITYYIRYYKLIAIAVLITVTVIVGSLVVGDSVRATLVNRVKERLGDTETIVFSRNSYISKNLLNASLFEESTQGILLVNGFISQDKKLLPVFVWSVDDMGLSEGATRINEALAKEINPNEQTDIILRLPAVGLVPSGSIFVTENYTTSLRLSFDGIVDVADGGNISMKNGQILPYNIFVNRQELAEVLEIEDKINLILSNKRISESSLSDIWEYESSGLSVNHKGDFTEILSDRVFIQKEVVEYISEHNNEPNRLFSYLANTIELEGQSIPYSFVTAIDRYEGEILLPDEVILSDYSARRLNAKTGDNVEITYFTSQDLKTLITKSIQLRVKKIVPLTDFLADGSLSANFPGLSDVERCTEWDSDLPINMNLITDEDERYWDLYRNTPKAIIAYNAVADDWGNAYGNATAIRITDMNPKLEGLTASMFGIQLIYPREAAIYAAENGVDFSGLFLALGFFIIISAMLLMLIPLSEMLFMRSNEINSLKALGYSQKKIIKMFWAESAPVVLVFSIIGVAIGLLYTSLIMWLLGNVWKGATHTGGFSIYPSITTIVLGLIIGIGLSLWLLRISIVYSLKEKKANIEKKRSVNTRRVVTIFFSVLSIVVSAINLIILHSVVLFIIVGILLIVTAFLWGDCIICTKGSASTDGLRSEKLIWNTLYANKKQVTLSFFALTIGVFIVFSVGLNRRGFSNSSQIKTGTGGYSLWVESTVPVYHNMMTEEGRSKLSLTSLPAGTKILQCLRYSADDASCLNLNKVNTPTVLGIDMDSLIESDFQITQHIHSPYGKENVFKQMNQHTDLVYPALVDETVLTWGLMMNVGDTLKYESDNGKTVGLHLVGTLSNSIFQGNILVDRNLFSKIWPETTGSEVFLLKVNEAERESIKNLISQALYEYGVIVSTTNDRLKQFNVVTDTYLTIFLTLGGIGLLLGIMSFIIVVRKNLAMRRNEIELYRTLGFPKRTIASILYKENAIVPLYAIVTGVISSLVGISINFMNTGIWIWLMALLFMLFFIVCVIIFVRKSVHSEIIKSGFSIQA